MGPPELKPRLLSSARRGARMDRERQNCDVLGAGKLHHGPGGAYANERHSHSAGPNGKNRSQYTLTAICTAKSASENSITPAPRILPSR